MRYARQSFRRAHERPPRDRPTAGRCSRCGILAAPKLIVEEAGGRLTDLEGRTRADGSNAVATNGLLHDEVLRAWQQDP